MTSLTEAKKIEQQAREIAELKQLLAQRTRAWQEAQRVTKLRRA